jgi:hypothetical protein
MDCLKIVENLIIIQGGIDIATTVTEELINMYILEFIKFTIQKKLKRKVLFVL